MIEIVKSPLTEEVVARLIELSHIWTEEDITYGYRPNTVEDLHEPCFLARDGQTIVGYAFGQAFLAKKQWCFAPEGTRCFEVEELYVLPAYRGQGIGKKLYQAIEAEARELADCLVLFSATKDYRRMLHFYNEENGLSFHSTTLFKQLGEKK